MSRFYSMLRSQMLKAQVEQDGRILRELVELLFTVREAWAELNNRLAASPEVLVAQAGSSANWKA
jgi:flagellin-specific chaperone FliS